MQISTDYGFAFLCTPKCASSSIEQAIKQQCNINCSGYSSLKHLNAERYSKYIIPLLKDVLPLKEIESFCLIREPLEWIESWYRFRSRDALKNINHPSHDNYTGNITFEKFIETYISNDPRPSFANLSTQYDFIVTNSGDIGVDCIFPMNRLDLVAEFLSKKVGFDVRISHKHISPNIRVVLNQSLKEQLLKYLEKDVELYNSVNQKGKFIKSLHTTNFSLQEKSYY